MVNQGVQEFVKGYFSLAMNHTEILQSLVHLNTIVLSMRTLRSVLKFAALYRRKEYSDILDVSIYLMELLRNSNKSHGYKFVHLKCIQKGFVIRQETVRLLLQIVDPAGVEHRRRSRIIQRRVSINKRLILCWRNDSYDKLKPYDIFSKQFSPKQNIPSFLPPACPSPHPNISSLVFPVFRFLTTAYYACIVTIPTFHMTEPSKP